MSNDPEWNLRIKIGMAKAALASNKPEVAVAALEDLNKSNPNELRVLQILTDAYLASNLKDSALIFSAASNSCLFIGFDLASNQKINFPILIQISVQFKNFKNLTVKYFFLAE